MPESYRRGGGGCGSIRGLDDQHRDKPMAVGTIGHSTAEATTLATPGDAPSGTSTWAG
jgi:hypothetical protein